MEQQNSTYRINYLLTAVIAGMIAIVAIAFLTVYPGVFENAVKEYQVFDNYEFQQYIGKFNYITLNNTLEQPETFDALRDQYLDLQYIADADQELVKTEFNSIMSRWSESLKTEAPNLEYYVVNDQNNKISTNNEAFAAASNQSQIDQIAKEYAFFAVVQYDEKGVPHVQAVKGMDAKLFESRLLSFVNDRGYLVQDYFNKSIPWQEEDYKEQYRDLYGSITAEEAEAYGYPTFEEFVTNMQGSTMNTQPTKVVETETYQTYSQYGNENLLKNVSNATYVYGIKQSNMYADGMMNGLRWEQQNHYEGITIVSLLALMTIMAFATFLLPYQYAKSMATARVILRFPVELLCGLGVAAVFVVYLSAIIIIPVNEVNYLMEELTYLGFHPNTAELIKNVIAFGAVFVTIAIAVEAVLLLKHIFHVGFFRYFIKNLLVFRIIRAVWRGFVRFINAITDINFSDAGKNRIRLAMFWNTLAVIALCAGWFFAIIPAILYNIVLYIVLRNKYQKARVHYNMLLKGTRNIAAGNLDASIEGEMGIYNPIKEEINNIREGFKKAVEEEVKSQNMKTELITNVSHDLKTPLTSIITYVDLLKDKHITEEQKSEYIAILERKSARLKTLIEDLFEMSKTTSKDIVLNKNNLNLVTLTKEVLVEFEDKLKAANLLVKAEYDEEKVVCYLDSQRSYRIIENLIGNIIKYTMPYTRVYVTVTREETNGIIIFKNISASELNCSGEKLMERFARGDASRNSNTEGSGLGLAIARGLTEAQGGTIQIDVDGDLFKVTLVFPISTVIEAEKEGYPNSETWRQEEMSSSEEVTGKENDWVKEFYKDLPPQLLSDEPIPLVRDGIANEVRAEGAEPYEKMNNNEMNNNDTGEIDRNKN